MALGWIGGLQYELIEPVSGIVDIFSRGRAEQEYLVGQRNNFRKPRMDPIPERR
jgi:hypothetical protein